jgi:hypothetical protein
MIATDLFAVFGWLLSLVIIALVVAVALSLVGSVMKRGRKDGGS